MTFPGHLYGVALNDRNELAAMADALTEPPYGTPPVAPVIYMKPRSAIARKPVRTLPGETLAAAPTLALLFPRDATRRNPADALECVGAACLAIDLSLPQASYYRPAVAQKNRDGFLVLGDWAGLTLPATLETRIDGKVVHQWRLDRLLRGPDTLIADLSAFMTLRAGDVLLIGLPGDAPQARCGQTLSVSASGLPSLDAVLEEIEP